MGLRQARNRSAVWSSLAAVGVVGVVVSANLWSMWHAEPEPTTLDPLQRLSALQHDNRHLLPESAQADASERADGTLDAGTAHAGGGKRAGILDASARGVHTASRTTGAGKTPEITRSCTVQPGENLGAALGHLFVQGAVQRQVIAAYAKLRKPERLQAGWRLWARFASDGGQAFADSAALLAVVVAPATGEGITVTRNDNAKVDAEFVATDGGLAGVVVRQPLRCPIVGALDTSLRRCGGDESMAMQVAVILSDRLHPALELRAGDELRLVIDKLMDGDQLVRYMGVIALQVRPVTGETVTALRMRGDHGEGYYAADGTSVEAMFLRQPLRTGRTTSGFGMRLHPILHQMKAHYGVDFAAGTGTPVFAAADGTLAAAHKAGAAGNLVRLRHSDGYVTEYMHLHKFAAGLAAGNRIDKGQTIGYVGTTGRSTGPHLHFGVKKNGKYLDPTSVSNELQPGLTARAKKAFASEAAELLKIINGLDRQLPASGA